MKGNKKGAELADSNLDEVLGGKGELNQDVEYGTWYYYEAPSCPYGRFIVTKKCKPGLCGIPTPMYFNTAEEAQAKVDELNQQI